MHICACLMIVYDLLSNCHQPSRHRAWVVDRQQTEKALKQPTIQAEPTNQPTIQTAMYEQIVLKINHIWIKHPTPNLKISWCPVRSRSRIWFKIYPEATKQSAKDQPQNDHNSIKLRTNMYPKSTNNAPTMCPRKAKSWILHPGS